MNEFLSSVVERQAAAIQKAKAKDPEFITVLGK